MKFSDSLTGTTVRDLVFLVQDNGCDAAAAQTQLLASHNILIKAAARRHPEVPNAYALVRDAFLDAVRNFRFVGNRSVATHCWTAMCFALDEAAVARPGPLQLPLLVEPIAVPVMMADAQLLQRIASIDAVRSLKTQRFGLSA